MFLASHFLITNNALNMARGKRKLVNLYAPSSNRRKAHKSSERLFPKFLVWIIAAIVLAGIVAKVLHQLKHH